MDFDNLDINPELQEKAKACTSPEELLELAQSEGRELSDEELEAVAGGENWSISMPGKRPCSAKFGDMREDIDPALVNADFVNGIVDGGEAF